MNDIELLDIDFDSEADLAVYQIAVDEMCSDLEFNSVFFFGKLVNDNPFVDEVIDEDKYYVFCPVCQDLIEQKHKPHDGEYYTCPHCSTEGKVYDYRDENSNVNGHCTWFYAYLELLDNGVCLRLYDVTLDYSGRDCNDYTMLSYEPDVVVEEIAREYWYDARVEHYKWNTKLREWVSVPTIEDFMYYIVNYNSEWDIHESSFLSDIVEFGKSYVQTLAGRASPKAYRTLKNYGFDCLAFASLCTPTMFVDSNKISKVLKLDYNRVIAYKEPYDINPDDILAMRELTAYDLSFSDKNMELMSVLCQMQPHVYDVSNVKKTFKYLRNQMSRVKHHHVANDYFDYISDCRKLGLDTERSDIRYPTDLSKAHTRTSALVKIEANRDINERIRDVYNRFSAMCEFSDGVYCIVMPSCADEIINEGKAQSHCVGSYAERMAKGEDIILFLRKLSERDKPFYTIEIRPIMKKLDVVQCRGYKNGEKSSAVDEFLAKYEAWFNSRKSDVECSLRRKYYKAVCKDSDGRYVSHWDNKTEYRIGEIIEAHMESNPDLTAVSGIHIASLDFAKTYGDSWANAAILEIEVDMRDVVIPNAKDQLRTKRGKVLREVPMSELGDWGVRHGFGSR